MIIPVNDNYRIASNARSWKVEKRAEGQWHPISWHSTPGDAAKKLALHQLMTSDVVGLEAGLKELDRITQQLTQALAPCLKMNVEDIV